MGFWHVYMGVYGGVLRAGAEVVSTRFTLNGQSTTRITLQGQSTTRITLQGQSTARVTLDGS